MITEINDFYIRTIIKTRNKKKVIQSLKGNRDISEQQNLHDD